MKQVMKYKLNGGLGVLLLVCLLISCGTVHRGNGEASRRKAVVAMPEDTLAPALQRK